MCCNSGFSTSESRSNCRREELCDHVFNGNRETCFVRCSLFNRYNNFSLQLLLLLWHSTDYIRQIQQQLPLQQLQYDSMFNNQALEDQYRVLCILLRLRLRLHLPSIHVIFFRLGFIVVVVESLFDLTFDWAKAHTHTHPRKASH